MLILLLALSSLTAPFFAESALAAKSLPSPKKARLLSQMRESCVENSFREGKSQEAACDCLRVNYEKRLNEEELELLARIQDGTVSKAELAGKDELLDFDMEASQRCVEDPAWRWLPAASSQDSSGETKKALPPKKDPAPPTAHQKKRD